MDRIMKAIKCIECENILDTPIILPCNHSICQKHLNKRNTGDKLRCAKCGINHEIPPNGFALNEALCDIIEAQISSIDFGSIHKEAAESLDRLTQAKQNLEKLLNNPSSFVSDKIGQLKNQVLLKSKQLKLKIDEETQKLLNELTDYQTQCVNSLSTDEFLSEKRQYESNRDTYWSFLSRWKSELNEIKFDESRWKKITEESNNSFRVLNEGVKSIKNELMLGEFKKYFNRVVSFQNVSIDDSFTRNGSSRNTIQTCLNSSKTCDLIGVSCFPSVGSYLSSESLNILSKNKELLMLFQRCQNQLMILSRK